MTIAVVYVSCYTRPQKAARHVQRAAVAHVMGGSSSFGVAFSSWALSDGWAMMMGAPMPRVASAMEMRSIPWSVTCRRERARTEGQPLRWGVSRHRRRRRRLRGWRRRPLVPPRRRQPTLLARARHPPLPPRSLPDRGTRVPSHR